MTADRAIDALRRVPVFAVPPRDWLARWVTRAEVQPLALGDVLFQPNTAGGWAFLILDGRVRSYRVSDDGREVALGVYSAGDTVGEYALVPPHQNTVGCRAASAGRALRLPLDPLRLALDRLPTLGPLKNWLRLGALAAHLNGRTCLDFLSPASYLGLLDFCAALSVPPGMSVQAPGFADDHWYYLESGTCARTDGAAMERLNAGATFGEAALLGLPCPPVVAIEHVTLRRLPARAFHEYRPDGGARPTGERSLQTFAAEPRFDLSEWEWIGQRTPDECGPAALAMAATALGVPTTLDDTRKVLPVGSSGASLTDIARAAAALGLTATGVRVDAATIDHVRWPAVARLRAGHYVTVFTAGGAGLTVGDPMSGVVRTPMVRFLEQFAGELLVFGSPTRRPVSPPTPGR